VWFKGHDFLKPDGSKVPLMYRMATDLDQKSLHEDKRSRYLWVQVRRVSCLGGVQWVGWERRVGLGEGLLGECGWSEES
jgi:hypothetical protein